MSSRPTKITDQIYDYIQETFCPEDEFLSILLADAEHSGFPRIHISRDQGRFLQFLIKSTNVRNILEIGSLAGYSAITMAKALPPDGRIVAVEKSHIYAEFIRNQFSRADLSVDAQVVNRDAVQFIKDYDPGFMFDLIFVDADKKNYKYYFEQADRLLRPGGIFIADNALAFGEIVNFPPSRNPEDVDAIRDFNNFIMGRHSYFSTLLAIGDGLSLSYKQ
jgi:predicted O-methyltransferase YrrM